MVAASIIAVTATTDTTPTNCSYNRAIVIGDYSSTVTYLYSYPELYVNTYFSLNWRDFIDWSPVIRDTFKSGISRTVSPLFNRCIPSHKDRLINKRKTFIKQLS